MLFKKLFVLLLATTLLTATAGCAKYGCPSNPKQVDLEKQKRIKPGTSTLFPDDVAKKKGVRSR